MKDDFNILEKKLGAFRRKYLLYQFLRGGLLVGALFIFFFTIINLLEYFLYMPQVWRKIIFVSSFLFFILLIIRYIIFPGVQLTGLVRILNYRKLTSIIRQYIPGVKDKLINVLELHESRDPHYSSSITEAAVSQKISELRFIDFSEALSLKNLKTIFLTFAASFLMVLVIFIADKSLLTVPGNRMIHFNQEFVKPAPYEFILRNTRLEVEKGNDFRVEMECRGNEIPTVMYINIGGNNFMMKPAGERRFEYDFTAVVRPVEFYFTDLKFNSGGFLLDVVALPVINSFTVEIVPPAYTGAESVKSENLGDLRVMAGSRLTWNFRCFDTDSLCIIFREGDTINASREGKNNFSVSAMITDPQICDVSVNNVKAGRKSAMSFTIQVVPDYYPEISVVQIPDSSRLTRFYFRGNIHDDYGFTRLLFHIHSEEKDSSFTIPVVPYLTDQEFYTTFDYKELTSFGKTISSYFSVSDNDGIKGPKNTTSDSFVFTFPDRKEIEDTRDEKFDELEKMLNESSRIASDLQQDIKELQMKNMNSDISAWEKSRLVEEIISEKNQLEQMLEQIEKLNSERDSYSNTFNEQGEEILKKQEKIQELLEDVMTEELKKLLEEFSKLAEDFNSKELNELSRKMEMSFEDLSKQLDRNLEMLRKMQLEQELEDIVKRVEEMKSRTLEEGQAIELEKDLKDMDGRSEESIMELDDIEQELNSVLEKNNEMEKPLNFDDFKEEFEEIRQDMQQSNEDLHKNNRKKSAGKRREASEKLGNMAFAMRQMLESNQSQENTENIRELRQILKNLVHLSFSQEEILERVRGTSQGDPALRVYSRQQRTLSEQSQVIRDSLYALANRSPEIGNVVNNEILAMEFNLVRAVELMGEGLFLQASANQQLVITAANNLALFLSDALQNMEDQMANSQPGDDSKPQGGKPGGTGSLQKQSENLRNQLQQMIEEMKSGKGGKMSRQMGESLMMHEMMQQMLRDLMNNGNMGGDARKQLQMADRLLEENRRDIMNKRIQPNLIKRQNEIMTRLLEAEKSEMERDQDNKRESHTADDQFYSNPARFFEKNLPKNISIENIQRNSLKMNAFFQDKYKNYVEKFNSHATE